MLTFARKQPRGNQGKRQGCFTWPRIILFTIGCGLLIYFIVTSLINIITYVEALSDPSLKVSIISLIVSIIGLLVGILSLTVCVIGALGTYFQWLVPASKALNKFQSMFLPLSHRFELLGEITAHIFHKDDFFISYNRSDHHWADWIDWQLRNARYSTKRREWDSQRSDFLHEMDIAHKKAVYTFTILSPTYLYMLRNNEEWYNEFTKRNWRKKKNISLVVQQQIPENLSKEIHHIDIVDLKNAAVTKEMLFHDLHSSRYGTSSKLLPNELEPPFPGDLPAIWNVPYSHNQLFTGREEFLTDLHAKLKETERSASIQPQAICALEGMGKTQAAIEYAYRNSGYYKAVLWVDATSRESLELSLKNIQSLLPDLKGVSPLDNLKKWLKEQDKDDRAWLLILDNCNDLLAVKDLIPNQGKGHIILTTCVQDTSGLANSIKLKRMNIDDGALLLLRRIKVLEPDETLDNVSLGVKTQARKISIAMGGLPFGIEQAGAYIYRKRCGLSGYLDHYQSRLAEILKEKPDNPLIIPPADAKVRTLATIWTDSFEKIKQIKPPFASYLLQFCAFFSSEPIPEELIRQVPDRSMNLLPATIDSMQIDQAIEELRRYSLIERSDGLITVHPLVQAVIREGVYEEKGARPAIQLKWAENAILAVHKVFAPIGFTSWRDDYWLYLPHAQACARHIKKFKLHSSEALQLLDEVGYYALKAARFDDAIRFFEQSQTIREKELGKGPLEANLAISLNRLAETFYIQGNYDKSEQFSKQAQAIYKNTPNSKASELATCLNNLAQFYLIQGKYVQAEPLYKEALNICKAILDIHEDEALKISRAVLDLRKNAKAKNLDQECLDIATSLNNLGRLYYNQGQNGELDAHSQKNKYTEAEALYEAALNIREEILGKIDPDPTSSNSSMRRGRTHKVIHPDVAISLNDLASLYLAQKNYSKAETNCMRAVQIYKDALGSDHLDTAQTRANLATIYVAQQRYTEAKVYYDQALEISKRILGDSHPQVAARLNNLAELYRIQGIQTNDAEKLYNEALVIYEKIFGLNHPYVANVKINYAALLRKLGRKKEAEELKSKAKAIRATHAKNEQDAFLELQKQQQEAQPNPGNPQNQQPDQHPQSTSTKETRSNTVSHNQQTTQPPSVATLDPNTPQNQQIAAQPPSVPKTEPVANDQQKQPETTLDEKKGT